MHNKPDIISYPFVEGVPLQVGGFQVMLQSLCVCVFSCTLDEALTHSIHMVQSGLDAVYLLTLHSLHTHTHIRQREKKDECIIHTFQQQHDGRGKVLKKKRALSISIH